MRKKKLEKMYSYLFTYNHYYLSGLKLKNTYRTANECRIKKQLPKLPKNENNRSFRREKMKKE